MEGYKPKAEKNKKIDQNKGGCKPLTWGYKKKSSDRVPRWFIPKTFKSFAGWEAIILDYEKLIF